ncbi:MAG TPA: sensor domain-containing diguanylate cyclase [Candidatus Omnitrophota bacterium]|nr:sensor domain-containing diguanylate cyclase [Candidatus Omnitrophota bacterium]
MDDLNRLKIELERTKIELKILYEVSNAMRTTLKLDEILYIILTGVTAHTGLGFNRAILFLVNEKEQLIEGKMGIGPENGEEANIAWTKIEEEKMDLEDLINAFKKSDTVLESGFNRQVRNLKVSMLDKNENPLSLAVLEGMPLHLTGQSMLKYQNSPVIKKLGSHELLIIPLKAKDRVNGIIVADNFITKEPITKDDIHMLTMLANQAGLAIENSQLFELTAERAHSDYLTNLWNHGYFQFLLQAELEKAKVTKNPLTLIMIDIDDFKIYNDTLGHQAGDKILRTLANLLRNQSRKMDLVCRYGGEEFTIILPHTDKNEAFLIAERIRMDIQKYPFLNEGIFPNKQLTVSLGVSTFPVDGLQPADLITTSDKALYQAKKQGKNNTCCN